MSVNSKFASEGVSSNNRTSIAINDESISVFKQQYVRVLPLAKYFFSMVEFSDATFNDITPLDFSSDFAIGMLEAFEEFDNLEPKGLITKQFEVIAQKCNEKGVQILIGKIMFYQAYNFLNNFINRQKTDKSKRIHHHLQHELRTF